MKNFFCRPGEITFHIACLVTSLAAFLVTSLLSHPLSTLGYSPLVHYPLLISTAGHAYRVVSYWTLGRYGGGRVLTYVVHQPAAILTYVTIMLTRENAMLGVAGFSYQVRRTLPGRLPERMLSLLFCHTAGRW